MFTAGLVGQSLVMKKLKYWLNRNSVSTTS
jgi:hypothetical protein